MPGLQEVSEYLKGYPHGPTRDGYERDITRFVRTLGSHRLNHLEMELALSKHLDSTPLAKATLARRQSAILGFLWSNGYPSLQPVRNYNQKPKDRDIPHPDTIDHLLDNPHIPIRVKAIAAILSFSKLDAFELEGLKEGGLPDWGRWDWAIKKAIMNLDRERDQTNPYLFQGKVAARLSRSNMWKLVKDHTGDYEGLTLASIKSTYIIRLFQIGRTSVQISIESGMCVASVNKIIARFRQVHMRDAG